MPLYDLSLVTTSLIRLLDRYIEQSPVKPAEYDSGNIAVTGLPPDMISKLTTDYALSVYLFHVEEDPHRKNLPAPSGNNPPVRFAEMGLNLYYLVTAHGGNQVEKQPYEWEQRLMSLAIKAFHDYPILDAKTQIGNDDDPFVLPDALRSDHDELRLVLRPTTLDDLNKIWTSLSVPVRLSTIYRVGVVLFKAEEPSVHPFPVLTPQIEVAPFQPVWVQATESDFVFTLPGESRSRLVSHSPAVVAVGESFRVLGFGFGGSAAQVFLRSPFWKDPPYVEVTDWIQDLPEGPFPTDTRLELQVTTPMAGRSILPGLYQIYVRHRKGISNFCPIAIAPKIASQSDTSPGIWPPSGPSGTAFTVVGGPFEGGGIRTVEVYLGSTQLSLVDSVPRAGEFRVLAPPQIDAAVPYELPPKHHPLRVVVNGIETPPIRWFEVQP